MDLSSTQRGVIRIFYQQYIKPPSQDKDYRYLVLAQLQADTEENSILYQIFSMASYGKPGFRKNRSAPN
jgi:hypothetical protein